MESALSLLLLATLLLIVFVRRSPDGSVTGTLGIVSSSDQPSDYSRLIADIDREGPGYNSLLEGMKEDLWHRLATSGNVGSIHRQQRIQSYLDAFSTDVSDIRSDNSISEQLFLELTRRHAAAISMMEEQE